jgi:hypothetical protein
MVRANQEALFENFEPLEAFLQRLEIYTELAVTVTKIMAEVFNVLANYLQMTLSKAG